MLTDLSKLIMRKLRLVKINRNFLVFLVFLAVSISFWFMQSIKETTEVNIAYKLRIVELPKNVILTSDIPQDITVTYSSKGWNAFYYKFMREAEDELTINFKEVDNNAGKVIIDVNNVRKAVQKFKTEGMAFKSSVPGKIEAFYSNGQHKRVPVIFNGHVSTTAGRYLCGINLSPDSVDIYAPEHLFKNIKSVKTENTTYKDVEDSITTKISLLSPKGVKVLPEEIEAEICVDIFTDKTIEVPIYSINVPNSKYMRTFPLKATVTFLVSATLFNEITADNFLIVADYNDTKSNSRRCKLYVRQQPENIRHLRLSPENVEYVIEEATE